MANGDVVIDNERTEEDAMNLMTKNMTREIPPPPDEAPAVVAAQERNVVAIRGKEQAQEAVKALRRILNDPDATPADKRRAWLQLDPAETVFLNAEADTADAQKTYNAARREAVEAHRPFYERRQKELNLKLDAALEQAAAVNEEARALWAAAYELGVELPRDFWPELMEPTPQVGSRLDFWRTILTREERL